MKKILVLVMCLLVCLTGVVYGEEEIVENAENSVSDVIVEENYLTYENAINGIVAALNERDSYFYEIQLPKDCIKYVKDLGVNIEEDLEVPITRLEFSKLYLEISEKIGDKHYQTDLISIDDIFIDLDGLSEDEKQSIETIFIEGLLAGVSKDKFSPNGLLTQKQLEIILERVKSGYSRHNLFSIVDSAYTQEERLSVLGGEADKELIYKDMVNLFFTLSPSKLPYIGLTDSQERVISIREFLLLYSDNLQNSVIVHNHENDIFNYPAKDTIILSAEEWEYFNTHLDKPILYSEAKLLVERTINSMEEIKAYINFENFEEIESLTNNYLGFISNLVRDYKTCIGYFVDYDNDSMIITNYGDFSRSIHEAQHEGSAKLSHRFAGRRKTEKLWEIRWNSKPSVYYYFDFTNSTWVDSKIISSPNTSIIFNKKCSAGVKEDEFLRDYATNSDYVSNIYGLQGLLQEYCSYGLQAKIEFINESLNLDKASVGHTNYDWYLMMKYMVIESLEYLKENNCNSYMTFMNDTDMVRFLNNTFKEMDYYEDVYKNELNGYRFWFSDDLLKWGYDLGCPARFVDYDAIFSGVSDIDEVLES